MNYGLMQIIGGVDNEGNPEVVRVVDGVLQTSVVIDNVEIDNGIPITGETLPSGSDLIGWLSWIKKFLADILQLLGDRLPVSLGAKTAANSLSIAPASDAIFVSNNSPLSPFQYEITDLEEGATGYFGYVDKDGNWIIKRVTSTTIRFVAGTSAYTTAWTSRTSQTYDYFNNIF